MHLRDLARVKIDFAVKRLRVDGLQEVPLLSVHLLPSQFGLRKLLEVIILLFIQLFVAFSGPGVFNFVLEKKVVFLKPIVVCQFLLLFEVAYRVLGLILLPQIYQLRVDVKRKSPERKESLHLVVDVAEVSLLDVVLVAEGLIQHIPYFLDGL